MPRVVLAASRAAGAAPKRSLPTRSAAFINMPVMTPWSRLGDEPKNNSTAQPVRTICVIGAGSSGLVAAKHLREAGYIVTILERTDSLGGAFEHKAYDNSRLVSSKYLTSFSDLRPSPSDPPHLSLASYVEYLDRYATAEDLHQLITYKAHVDAVRKGRLTTTCRDVNAQAPYIDETKPGYVVRVAPVADAYPVGSSSSGTTSSTTSAAYYVNGRPHKRLTHATHLEFDAVCICSGLHEVPYAPSIPNMEGFTGQVLHSATYKDKQVRTRHAQTHGSRSSSKQQCNAAVQRSSTDLTTLTRPPSLSIHRSSTARESS